MATAGRGCHGLNLLNDDIRKLASGPGILSRAKHCETLRGFSLLLSSRRTRGKPVRRWAWTLELPAESGLLPYCFFKNLLKILLRKKKCKAKTNQFFNQMLFSSWLFIFSPTVCTANPQMLVLISLRSFLHRLLACGIPSGVREHHQRGCFL